MNNELRLVPWCDLAGRQLYFKNGTYLLVSNVEDDKIKTVELIICSNDDLYERVSNGDLHIYTIDELRKLFTHFYLVNFKDFQKIKINEKFLPLPQMPILYISKFNKKKPVLFTTQDIVDDPSAVYRFSLFTHFLRITANYAQFWSKTAHIRAKEL